ncbi:MAG: CCA tRNA nucleotidyltransferase [Candidatus Micrarchaeota archaeon]|nr:CCA tRNA nucleotidyltransferase [Candidatus Micrarchaeota archaeon]
MSREKAGEAKRKAIEAIAKRVSSRITPTKEEAEAEKKLATRLIASLRSELGPEPEIKFIGSAARDTGLRGDRDIDLFVAWPRERSREFIVQATERAAKEGIPAQWVMHYAEHPYLRTAVEGFEVEVIPCFQMKPHEQLKSAVDRSILHMDYLQKHLTPEQKRDVRVLKKLLKTAGIYGAEAEIEGFSGLVCEQLLLNYRSLAGLVENAAQWKPPVFVDVEGIYSDDYARSEVLKKFSGAPIILIDAVDKNRNAAAATSATNAHKFISLSRALWEKPSEKFFFRPETRFDAKKARAKILGAIRTRGAKYILLSVKKPAGIVDDILLPQLRKTGAALARQLALGDFKVFDQATFAAGEECFILLELASGSIPPVRKITGPPVTEAGGCKKFVQAHRNCLRGPYVEGDRLFAETRREFTEARKLVQKTMSDPVAAGAASHFVEPLKKAVVREDSAIGGVSPAALQKIWEHVFRKDWWLE